MLTAALAGGSGIGLASAAPRVRAAQEAQATLEADQVGQATMPAWIITVSQLQDPYQGEIQAPPPAEQPAGTRFVAAEIVVENDSDQPLGFTPVDLRLVDAAGTEYRGGLAAGTEPFLAVRNMNGGDRIRGWVWFILPEAAELAELLYVAPAPVLRIAIA